MIEPRKKPGRVDRRVVGVRLEPMISKLVVTGQILEVTVCPPAVVQLNERAARLEPQAVRQARSVLADDEASPSE